MHVYLSIVLVEARESQPVWRVAFFDASVCVKFVQQLLLAMQAAADSWKYFLDWKGIIGEQSLWLGIPIRRLRVVVWTWKFLFLVRTG